MLIDTTLREGEQLFGLYLSMNERKEIVRGLMDIGIEEIELGNVAQEDIAPLFAWATGFGGTTRFSLWSPARKRFLKSIPPLPGTGINIGLPSSDAHMAKRLDMTRSELLEHCVHVVKFARSLGWERITIGLEDASRADPSFLVQAARTAQRAGAFCIRVSDTVGLWKPLEVASLIAQMKREVGCTLAVHCHNDFGMATANALTGLDSGADAADVSILGIGERSGIASLEELAGYLTLKAQTASYRMKAIPALSQMVSARAKLSIPRTRPIVGDDIFACETGLHVHGILKDPTLFEPYAPECVNTSRRIGLGKKTGRAAVSTALNCLTPTTGPPLAGLVSAIRTTSLHKSRPLTSREVKSLLDQL
ncbi:MAG: LeuA family protein [Desulfovibrionales bacterium]